MQYSQIYFDRKVAVNYSNGVETLSSVCLARVL
jgi:hypothetical protein